MKEPRDTALSFKTNRCKIASASQEEMSLFFTSSSFVASPEFAGLTETVDEEVDFCSQVCVSSAQTDFGEVGSAPLNQPPESCLDHCTEECA